MLLVILLSSNISFTVSFTEWTVCDELLIKLPKLKVIISKTESGGSYNKFIIHGNPLSVLVIITFSFGNLMKSSSCSLLTRLGHHRLDLSLKTTHR